MIQDCESTKKEIGEKPGIKYCKPKQIPEKSLAQKALVFIYESKRNNRERFHETHWISKDVTEFQRM